MIGDVVIEMMSSEFLLWRCLHGAPLTKETVDQPQPHPNVPWEQFRARNLPLLAKLTETEVRRLDVLERRFDAAMRTERFGDALTVLAQLEEAWLTAIRARRAGETGSE